jgi:hypothetical protein
MIAAWIRKPIAAIMRADLGRVHQPCAGLRGRPPFAPFARAAAAFAGEVAWPAMRASSRAIQAREPKMPDTSAGT